MVIIKFPNGTDWYKANWVYGQLAQDVIENFPEDSDVKRAIEEGGAYGTLFVNSMDKELATKTLQALKTVAERTMTGQIEGLKRTRPDDLEGHRMYLKSIAELLDLIKEQMIAP